MKHITTKQLKVIIAKKKYDIAYLAYAATSALSYIAVTWYMQSTVFTIAAFVVWIIGMFFVLRLVSIYSAADGVECQTCCGQAVRAEL